MNNKTYTIIDSVNLSAVTFSEVMETSINTVRKNNDDSLAVLKYVGAEPVSLIPIAKVNTDGRDYHNHEQILNIMSTTGTTGWATIEII